MIKTLYPVFQKWSEKGSVYIMSDTHFDDPDCKIMNPNWISAEEQLKILQQKIHKNDTLVLLGDVGNIKYIHKIKGYKVLILGNHDKGASYYQKVKKCLFYNDSDFKTEKEVAEQVKQDYPDWIITGIQLIYDFHAPFIWWEVFITNGLFDEIYTGALFIAEQILLSHEPIYSSSLNREFCYNIHGHVHNGTMRPSNGLHLNVAADVCGYTPINLGEEIKNGVLTDIPTIHQITIDHAKDEKNEQEK